MTYFTTGVQLQDAIDALPVSKKGDFKAFDGFYYGEKHMAAYSGTLSPLEHFVQIGAARGYAPSAAFDPAYYANSYADLKGANLNSADLLYHFLQYGLDEGRAPNAKLAGFNGTAYLENNADVATYVNANLAQFGGSVNNGALAHYVKFGQFEGRGDGSTSSFKLTTGQDDVAGTSGNDTFTARIFDNQNTLQSGDAINGGAGTDTLIADIGNSQNFAITPELNSVENVKIRVQADQRDSGDNNIAGVGIIDAERSVGVTHWESNNSRADLIVEDVRIAASQITKDITIAMVETDPGHVDMGVYFDQYSLRAQTNTSSSLTLQLMDTRSNAAGTGPLKDSPYEGFAFNLTAPGATSAKLITLTSEAIDNAQTYAELVDAINAAIATKPELKSFTAKLGGSFTVSDTLGSLQTGTEVVISANDGSTVSAEGVGAGWIAKGAVPPSSGLHTLITSDKSNTTDLVTSTIILDDVGRGSTGGDLIVGGLSVGDTSTSKGVDRFEIEVRDNSKLQTINSTNNTLKEVVLKNGVTTSLSANNITVEKDAGALTVNGIVGAAVGSNTALPGSGAQHNAFGFSDVRLIDGSAMTGKLAFTAEVTDASIAKYLNVKDVMASTGDNVAFLYNGGANNDTINVTIDSDVAASRTMTGREDFTFTLDGGAGNDNLTVNIGGQETGAWYVDQSYLKNIAINGGSGNDTINTVGAGDFRIDAGADNDTVYTDNIGHVGAQWVVAAANTNLVDLQGSAAANAAAQFLYKGKLTVTFSGANANAAGGLTAGAAAAKTNGFEKTVDISTAENNAVNQYHINQAIKNAINEDDVLKKLLVAEDGPGTTLVIKSLVGGAFNAADLNIKVAGVDVTTLSAPEQTTVLNAYKAFAHKSDALIAEAQAAQAGTVVAKNAVEGLDTAGAVQGTDAGVVVNGNTSTAATDNIISMGSGNDVLVLSTSAIANETLVYTGYGQGNDTIVNFSVAGTSTDLLDFSAYLTGKQSASGSVASQKNIATTLNADANVEANSVTVLNTPVFTTAQAFDGLTAEKLKAAVNSTNVTGTSNYAGLQVATLDAVTSYTATNSLVGGVGKAVVLVENNNNLGQYKVFELTFDGTGTNLTKDFSDVKLIGELDFGNSLTGLSGVNLKGAVDALITGAAGAGGVPPVVVPPVGGFNPVNVTAAGAAGTAAADAFVIDAVAALADVAGTNFQSVITGFDIAADKLRIDLPAANAAITNLSQLNGQQGVSVQYDPFANATLINLGNDANGGEVVTITLAGVADASTVMVDII